MGRLNIHHRSTHATRPPWGASWLPVWSPVCATRRALVGVALLAAVLLVACGGDSGIRITAITSTPSTSTATPTPASLLSAAPAATLAPVPEMPENPFAAGRVVEGYLASGNPDLAGCLPDLVRTWRLATEIRGPRCLLIDIDGDRQNEYAFVISFPVADGPQPADLWFFESPDEGHRFFNSARALANGSASGLYLRYVEDLTGDGAQDIVATWEDCDGSTCVTHLLIASHHNGVLEDLAPDDTSIEGLEKFEVSDGTISMQGGLVSSEEAGPQRGATHRVSWAGSRFRLETVPGEAAYLVHLVNDADRAFAAADYQDAQAQYLAATSNSTLPDWKAEVGQPAGRAELRAYSTFRAALAAGRAGDVTESLVLLGRAATEYPDTMHGSIAAQYLAVVGEGATASQACSAVEIYIEAFQAQYVEFWEYGTANPERNVFTLCR
ncbi:MAG: hypothetical protein M0R73_09955 [Dehalococcoidia bacterium]|nr:hypothetical protein [Dehalococcoidia bacterium]